MFVNGATFNVKGQMTLGENIADAGGLRAAFYAMKRFARENPAPQLTPVFTDEQVGSWPLSCVHALTRLAVARVRTRERK